MTGQELRSIREELGYSQDGFAKVFGVTVRTIQNWEAADKVTDKTSVLVKAIQQLLNKGTINEPTHEKANTNIDELIKVVLRQQEQMSRQLETMSQMLAFYQKRDEQIDRLITLIERR